MNHLLPLLIFKYYQISTSWRRRARIKDPIFPTMPTCENIPVGSVIRTGPPENETIFSFESLGANLLGGAAAKHAQPSTGRGES